MCAAMALPGQMEKRDQLLWLFLNNGNILETKTMERAYMDIFGISMKEAGLRSQQLKTHLDDLVDKKSNKGGFLYTLKQNHPMSAIVQWYYNVLGALRNQLVGIVSAASNGMFWSKVEEEYRRRHRESIDFSPFNRLRSKPFDSPYAFLAVYFRNDFELESFREDVKLTLVKSPAMARQTEDKPPAAAELPRKKENDGECAQKVISFRDIMAEEEKRAKKEKSQKSGADGGSQLPCQTEEQNAPHSKELQITSGACVRGRRKEQKKRPQGVSLLWNETQHQMPIFAFGDRTENSDTRVRSDADIAERFAMIREDLAQQGRHFNVFDILQELYTHYGVQSVRELRTRSFPGGVREEREIPGVVDFLRLQDEVNTFIHAYCMAYGVAVLHDLEQRIIKIKDVSSFKHLKLGPLHRLPLVYKHFKFPHDAVVPTVTIEAVMSGLWRFMGEKKKPPGQKYISQEEFLVDLAEKRGLKSSFELGIKIRSFGLLISIVRKAKFGFMEKQKEIEKHVQMDMEKDVETILEKLRKDLVGQRQMARAGAAPNLIGEVAGLNIEEAILKIFKFAMEVEKKSSMKVSGNGIWVSAQRIVETMIILRQNPLFVKMFHVIVARGLFQALGKEDTELLLYLGFDKAVEELLQQREKESAMQNRHGVQNTRNSNLANVPVGMVLEKCRKYFEQCDDVVDLCTLARLETELTRCHNGAHSFLDLGHGTFLHFLNEHPELLRSFGSHVAVAGSTVPCRTPERFSRIDTKDFLWQCPRDRKVGHLFELFCDQFELDQTSSSLKKELDEAIKANMDSELERRPAIVVFQNALLVDAGTHLTRNSERSINQENEDEDYVEVDGISWGSEEDALNCLLSTPVLEDLATWTHWDTVFRRRCGGLKAFLRRMQKERDFGAHNFQGLEVRPGLLLRILPRASCDDFRQCLASSCPNAEKAAGLIVSIICNSGGLGQAPLALLANILQSTLVTLSSQKDDLHADPALGFAMRCISKIPLKLASQILQKVFLHPLEQIYGAHDLPALLLKACQSRVERAALHQLGVLTAEQAWIQDFRETMVDTNKVESSQEVEHESVASEIGSLVASPSASESTGLMSERTFLESVEVAAKSEREPEEEFDLNGSSDSEEGDEETISACRLTIEEIRREEFGIGQVFGERETRLIEAHHARLGRSLERLSKELYTKDTHFVLELVQNADDNKYSAAVLKGDGGQTPAVAFVIEKDVVSVYNNELGFNEENVRAICDVGKTTKGVHRKGYIGQKGIGFKSIFRVTDCPEVHSNGYHIRFDARTGSIGYILPEWMEESSEDKKCYPSSECDDMQIEWTTRIVLPLKPEIVESRTSLSARFHDIHPSLLLFLNRLQVIAVDDKVNAKSLLMKKRILGNSLVELSTGGIPTLWLVLTEEIPIEVRPDIATTDISLAFPIDDPSHASLKQKTLPVQPVFAFLPLRSYGFKFVIQADFEVPSSREDIDRDSPWNQWILEKLPVLVAKAFRTFQTHHSFTPLSGAARFFRFMSLEDEILGSFRLTAGRIIKLLQTERCIPVESPTLGSNVSSGDKAAHQWVIPSSTLIQHPLLKSIVSAAELKKYLNLHYMVEEVQQEVSSSLLAALGVKSLCLNYLIDILTERLSCQGSSEERNADEETAAWVGRWLYCLTQYLEAQHDCSSQTLCRVRGLRLLPLAGGSLVSLESKAVFFPTQRKQSECAWLSLLDKDLCTLSSQIFRDLDDLGVSRVEHFLENLGVRQRGAREIIVHHILPVLKSKEWKGKGQNLLVAYIRFVHQQWQLDAGTLDLEALKPWLVLLTSQGLVRPADCAVYFSKAYGNAVNYQEMFPGPKWSILSDEYLRGEDLTSIRNFFFAMGVRFFFDIRKKTIRFYSVELEKSVWETLSKDWPVLDDALYLIEDFSCPELEAILRSKGEIPTHKQLFKCLSAGWHEFLAPLHLEKKTAIVRDSSGREIGKTYSAISLLMKTQEWIPGDLDGQLALYRPKDLFYKTSMVYDILDRFCPYIAVDAKDENFLDFLEVCRKIIPDLLVSFLKQWMKDAEFSTSVPHMERVYKELQGAGPSYLSSLQDEPFIFFPKENDSDSQRGEFLSREELRWKDPSGVLKKRPKLLRSRLGILSEYYDNTLHDFFCDGANVQETPTTRDYLEMTEILASSVTLVDPVIVADLQAVFAMIGHKCIRGAKEDILHDIENAFSFREAYEMLENYVDKKHAEFVYNNAKDLEIFPTTKNSLVSLKRKPVIADDKECSNIFGEEKGIFFIDMGHFSQYMEQKVLERTRKPRGKADVITSAKASRPAFIGLLLFYKACQIDPLSTLWKSPVPQSEGSKDGCRLWHAQLINVLSLTQRLLYSRFEGLYKQVLESGLPDFLANARFYTCQKLDYIHTLVGFEDVQVPRSQSLAWEFSEFPVKRIHIHIREGNMEDKDDIISSFLGLFVPRDDRERDYIASSIVHWHSMKEDERERVLSRKNISVLPDSERVWTLPDLAKDETMEPKKPSSLQLKKGDKREKDEAASWPPPAPGEFQAREDKPKPQDSALKNIEVPPPPPEWLSQPGKLDDKDRTRVQAIPSSSNPDPRDSENDTGKRPFSKESGKPRVGEPIHLQKGTDAISLDAKPRLQHGESDAVHGAISKEKPVTEATDVTGGSDPGGRETSELEVDNDSTESQPSSPSKATKDVISSSPSQSKERLKSPSALAIECEEVPAAAICQDENIRSLVQQLLPDTDSEVGRRGELIVYEYLRRKHHEALSQGDVEIVWQNEASESGLPYDIRLTWMDDNPVAKSAIFVEVKTTTTDQMKGFEISKAEIEFALKKEQQYHLYRVSGLGNAISLKVKKLEGLSRFLDSKAAKLYIMV